MERTSQLPPVSNFKCPKAKNTKLETQGRYMLSLAMWKTQSFQGFLVVTAQPMED